MKPKDRANELIDKFGIESIKMIDYTIEVWEIKLEDSREKKHERGINICVNTLKYWNKVKNIIKNEIK